MEFSITPDIMQIHFAHFFHSLQGFPDKYLPLIFRPDGPVPEHLAYLCPLCLTNCFMIAETGIHYSSDFSLDHFPPESAGGRLKVLVCKKCNNESGYKYDFSLKEKMDSMSFNKKVPSSNIKIKSEFSDIQGRYHSEMSIRDDGETEISFKPNPDKVIPPLDAWIEDSKDRFDWKADLTIKIPSDEKVAKAILKVAYLYCFINWGYEFIFSDQGELLRETLNDNAKYPVNIPSFWLDHEVKSHGDTKIPRGLCFIQTPKAWQAFVVNVPLLNKQTGYSCVATVFIPNPTPNALDNLKNIQQLLDSSMEPTVTFVPLKNYLQEKIFPPYTKTWEALMHEYLK